MFRMIYGGKTMQRFDPIESLANMRHEFGEHGGVNMSIEASTTFTVMDAETMPEIFQGQRGPDRGCYLYGRHFNPTVYVLGRELAALEGAEAGYCTSSGMSAISGTLLQLCRSGDHIVSSNTVYGGTFALLNEYLPERADIHTTFVDPTRHEDVDRAFTKRTRVLYVESLSNPTLRVADIPRLAEIAHRHQAVLVVDNTFSPLILSPIQLGADIVVHSLTKFINGASDIVAGAVVGTTEFIMSLMDLHNGSLMLLGPTMDPRMAFDISARLPHLGLRITEHSRRAAFFAERCQDLGVRVVYPGLSTHPDHELLAELAHPTYGAGGVFGIDLGSLETAERFMAHLQNRWRFGFMAVSLGYFDTLMSASAVSTSSEMPEEDRERAGISSGLVRISIGYTGSLEQRWEQFENGLLEVGAITKSPA
jgi:methionine-gamma-lyase